MHRYDSSLVSIRKAKNKGSQLAFQNQNESLRIKVDESVTGRISCEFVGHHFDGDDAVLAQLHHGRAEELLIHVGL